jgi:hypothetical protein
MGEVLKQILEEQAREWGRETGFIKRERAFDGADFAISLIFGWLQDPTISLEGLVQVLGRREVYISASGLSQRFNQASADLLKKILQALVAASPVGEVRESHSLLDRFEGVLIEDATTVVLPAPLRSLWRGSSGNASPAAVKLYVCWDQCSGQMWGPELTHATNNDHRSPLPLDLIKPAALSLVDLGFYSQDRIAQVCRTGGYLSPSPHSPNRPRS